MNAFLLTNNGAKNAIKMPSIRKEMLTKENCIQIYLLKCNLNKTFATSSVSLLCSPSNDGDEKGVFQVDGRLSVCPSYLLDLQ